MVSDSRVKSNVPEDIMRIVNNVEPYASSFYKEYDRLIWDISSKWYKALNLLSKGSYELEDIHNELWAYVYKKITTYDVTRGAKISSWIYMICDSKAGMIKRSLETKKNNMLLNESNSSLNSYLDVYGNKTYKFNEDNKNNKIKEVLDLISDQNDFYKKIDFEEFILDFVYSLLELIDTCTEKERKVYLLKIKGKNRLEIAEEANVSVSYIPKVFKRLSFKFKTLYESLNYQNYIDKKERDELVRALMSKKSSEYISTEYDLECETVCICREILYLAGIYII